MHTRSCVRDISCNCGLVYLTNFYALCILKATRVRYRRYPGCASKSDGNIELAREVVLMNCKELRSKMDQLA